MPYILLFLLTPLISLATPSDVTKSPHFKGGEYHLNRLQWLAGNPKSFASFRALDSTAQSRFLSANFNKASLTTGNPQINRVGQQSMVSQYNFSVGYLSSLHSNITNLSSAINNELHSSKPNRDKLQRRGKELQKLFDQYDSVRKKIVGARPRIKATAQSIKPAPAVNAVKAFPPVNQGVRYIAQKASTSGITATTIKLAIDKIYPAGVRRLPPNRPFDSSK